MTDTHTEALVERVAEAMCSALNTSPICQWDKLHTEERALYETAARAAIEALPARNDERALKLVEAVTDEGLARLFHETYERLAPSFSYQTRKASAVPWADVPPNNKALMIAVCHHVRAALASQPSQEQS